MIGGRYERLFIGGVKRYMESLLSLEHRENPSCSLKEEITGSEDCTGSLEALFFAGIQGSRRVFT